ncbi:hypothetical protein [Cryobacterium sp.]|uniref:hypothetical protein n=1 Tax=Cryobacterium sp. TaxID=1926290 RepID=UPI0026096B54|nr:hypothetical protein [Cryobacterium sp.]MCU1447829.1 hypothetical protein [Cryobacterium sp.]
MPANFSARAFLWIGISLLVGSALLQAALDFLFRMAGSQILQSLVNSWWYSVLDVTRALFVPLGPLMLAAFFVARAIERSSEAPSAVAPGAVATNTAVPSTAVPSTAVPSTAAPLASAPRTTAVWVFGAGVALTLFGILVAGSLDSWLIALNAQGRTSLALDAVNLVVVPLRTVVLPLGLALLPAAALVKKIESRHPVTTAAEAPAE